MLESRERQGCQRDIIDRDETKMFRTRQDDTRRTSSLQGRHRHETDTNLEIRPFIHHHVPLIMRCF